MTSYYHRPYYIGHIDRFIRGKSILIGRNELNICIGFICISLESLEIRQLEISIIQSEMSYYCFSFSGVHSVFFFVCATFLRLCIAISLLNAFLRFPQPCLAGNGSNSYQIGSSFRQIKDASSKALSTPASVYVYVVCVSALGLEFHEQNPI